MTYSKDNTGIILGVDPGTRTTGYCAMRVNLETLERVDMDAFTVNALKPKHGDNIAAYLPEDIKDIVVLIEEQQNQLAKILEDYKPFQIALELPFFNSLRPTAFAPLVTLFTTFTNTIYNYNPWMVVHEVENTVTKSMVAPDSKEERKRIRLEFKDSKSRIAECIRIHSDFKFIDTSKLDEHQVDAALVAEHRRRQLSIGLI